MIQRRKKTCKKCGNLKLLFSRGLCDSCYKKEYAKPLKKKRKAYSRKTALQDHEFYQSIWDIRPHYCCNCGDYLGSECKTIYCDHILEKSKYPEFRYEPDNIWLLCWTCHTNKTNGIYSEVMVNMIKEVRVKLLNEREEGEDTEASS